MSDLHNQSHLDRLVKKWSSILDLKEAGEIKDGHRKAVTAQLLENQQVDSRKSLYETPTNAISMPNGSVNSAVLGNQGQQNGINVWDPILVSLVRRTMPNLMAYDICGVQPLSGPTGLIFAMRAKYDSQSGDEALFNEADTRFSAATGSYTGSGFTGSYSTSQGVDPFSGSAPSSTTGLTVNGGLSAGVGESLGETTTGAFNEMAFTIEKTAVEAKTRALKAEYSLELAQDLKAVHGLDAETELANILSGEILAEINREVVRTIYRVARLGCRSGTTTTAGIFDLNLDSNGRWSQEKFKGLLYHIEREANQIAKETRRGRGNFVVCSSDVASALATVGVLDYAPAAQSNLNVDDTGNTFVGTLAGSKIRVYIDPYASLSTNFACVGYKGSSPYDAGIFYCPYVPLQLVRAVSPDTFQPKIAFKTRYGLVSNPFVFNQDTGAPDGQTLGARRNQYYRIFRVDNLM